ncbi:hypothetical protein BC629DRAFT_1589024 [Irpex lacteus]|nr:hypothetical protein BC629DRAFT_1589024 [Irpex lacteus]
MADTDSSSGTPALESPEDTVSLRDKIIHDALSKHNASQRIFSLSTEVLCIILAHLRDMDPAILHTWLFPIRRRLGWVAVTHVSSRFRSVALEDAHLWSDIRYTGALKPWSLEFLKRSRNVPITLEISDDPDAMELESSMDEDFLSLFRSSESVSRIRMLRTDTSMSSVSFLRVFFTHTTTQLQDFTIHRSLLGGHPFEQNLVTIPPLDYGWRAPSLQYLCLKGGHLSWSILTSLDLSHLCVAMPEDDDDTPRSIPLWQNTQAGLPTDTSAKALFDALCTLPRLQILELSYVIPKPLNVTTNSSISLPNLARLYLEDIHLPCLWLLDSINAPQLSSLDITLKYLPETLDSPVAASWYGTLARFMDLVVQNTASAIRTIQLMMSDDRLDIDIWKHPVEPNDIWLDAGCDAFCTMKSPLIRILIVFDHMGPAARCASVARRLVSGLPLGELDVLKVCIDTPAYGVILDDSMDYDRWRQLYELFWHAKSVIARGTAIVTLLPLLASCDSPTWKLRGYSQPRAPLFPGLKQLTTEIGTRDITELLDDCLEDTSCSGDDPHRIIEEDDDESDSEYYARLNEAPPRKGSIDRHLAFAHSCLASRAGRATILEYLYLALPDEEPKHGKLWESDVDALFGDVVRKLEIGIFNYFETV